MANLGHTELGSSAQARDDPLTHLGSVDWASLHTKQGFAADIPTHLRDLLHPDRDARREPAAAQLLSSLFWDKSPHGDYKVAYDATPHVVRLLLSLVDDPRTPDRNRIIEVVAWLSIGFIPKYSYSGFNARRWRDEVEGNWRNADLDERARQFFSQNVDKMPPDLSEAIREDMVQQICTGLEETRNGLCYWLAAYDAVREAIPLLRKLLLHDPDALVRNAVAYLLAFFPEDAFGERGTLAILLQLLEGEQVPLVRWTAIIATGLLQAWLPPVASPEDSNLPVPDPPDVLITDHVHERASAHVAILESILEREDSSLSDTAAAAVALSRIGHVTPRTVARMEEILIGPIRIVIDNDAGGKEEIRMDNLDDVRPLLFRGDGRPFAAQFFGTLNGEDYPHIVDALLFQLAGLKSRVDGRPFSVYDLILIAAIDMTFPDKKTLISMPPFEQLTELQKDLIRELASLDKSVYHCQPFLDLIGYWDLPRTLEDCRQYAGLN